jgi:hypothetical protein
MNLVRISRVSPLHPYLVELELTNGQIARRDIADLMQGPAFEAMRKDESLFRQVRAEAGGLACPNGADLCPDAVLWGGLPEEGLCRRTSTCPLLDRGGTQVPRGLKPALQGRFRG